MTAALLFSATLSIATTNGYLFTTPATTNIVGIGIGKNADHTIIRGEDISFLREAFEERTQAVRGYNPSPGLVNGIPSTNDYSVSGPMYVGLDVNLAYLFPESFDPEDGGWRQYRYIYRGNNNSFVSDDFGFISGGYTPVPCTTNWIFDVPGLTNCDLRASYLPFVNWTTRMTPPDILKTNSPTSVLTLMNITNAYHNLDLAHDIVTTASCDQHAEDYSLYGPVSVTNKQESTHSGYTASHTYTYYTYDDRQLSYPSGYDIISQYSTSNPYTYGAQRTEAPFASARYYRSVTYSSTIGWKRISSTTFERAAVLSPILTDDYSYSLVPEHSDTVKAFCRVITTNNWNRCSDVCALAVIGLKSYTKETRYSTYGMGDVTNITTETFGVTAARVSLTKTDEVKTVEGGRSAIAYSTDLDIVMVLEEAADFFGRETEPSHIRPQTDSVPDTGTGSTSSVVGHHSIDHVISIEWIRFLFRFKRDFNAKVLNQ